MPNINFTDHDNEGEELKLPVWYDWVIKNSIPKNYYYPRKRRKPTRWQKPGPMKKKDWKIFFQWAATRAEPHVFPHLRPSTEPPKLDRRGKPIPEPGPPPIDTDAQNEKMAQLAVPRVQYQKYVFPKKPKYPYLPQFDPKKPRKPEKGRPFRAPRIPDEFPHYLIEAEFWSILRFPVSRPATKCKAKPRTVELAVPRAATPLKQHCPIPEKIPEYVPPRKKMTYRQWRQHLIRLQYLAKPILRPIDWDLYET